MKGAAAEAQSPVKACPACRVAGWQHGAHAHTHRRTSAKNKKTKKHLPPTNTQHFHPRTCVIVPYLYASFSVYIKWKQIIITICAQVPLVQTEQWGCSDRSTSKLIISHFWSISQLCILRDYCDMGNIHMCLCIFLIQVSICVDRRSLCPDYTQAGVLRC